MGFPPIPRADVFIPLSPHVSFRSPGFLPGLPVGSKILTGSRITTVDFCQSCLDHFNIDVLTAEGDNAEDTAIPIATELFNVYGLVGHQS